MNATLSGIHHVTAITSDVQQNIDFYCGVLGLRLVKLTVNFDDPSSYHLYYGDELGRPGTVMTFFAWAGARRGAIGPPQVTTTAFAVPVDAINYWSSRLKQFGVSNDAPIERFSEPVLHITDPDGLGLDIVGVEKPGGQPWTAGPVPVEHAIQGFHGVTISEEGYESTANVLTKLMNFTADGNDGNRFRYRAQGDGFAEIVDFLCVPDGRGGGMGAGVVHHVAFRTPDRPQQDAWHSNIVQAGLNVSPVMDRNYFQSIYFREPGGVLFEIATDGPGFTTDEPAEQLGAKLMLPKTLEQHRAKIESILPAVRLPLSEK
ncbi:MAG: ring-cleaving dioxygenase [Candidatus Hydrogenedentes bacterium]|nr:ring-cleaving dioxygenase [Candidatus Hydrogenedentota bacterium]